MNSFNWNFKVCWLGEEHIVVSFKKQDSEQWQDFTFTVREYAEFMGLLQDFNVNFKEKLDQKLLESYFNE
jgi:hypothetical protein